MQAAIRRWLIPRSTHSDQTIYEQNLRIMLLVLFPLAAVALLSQITEWVVTGRIYVGVPISGIACLAILLLAVLTHARHPELAEWLLVLLLVPIVGVTTLVESFTGAYNVLELVITVTLSAILLSRWAIFPVFALTFSMMGVVALLVDTAPPPTEGPVLLTLFAYGAITISIVVLIYYLRLLFDRQILLLQTANQQTRAALLEARAANESQARFLATMSHELRTPLNAIQGYTELMIYGYYPGGTPAVDMPLDLLQTIQRSNTRLLTLINEVLDVARLEAGREIVQLSNVDVVALITDMLDAQRVAAQSKHVALNFTIGDKAPRQVTSDAPKLGKIVNNLIANAVKFTPSGSVHVTLDSLSDGYWRFSVQDTGIGIPPDQVDRIFERFYQVDSSETRQYKGSGLGLAIVKETVIRLDGTISVQSQQKQGTLFIVTLPYRYSDVKEIEK